MDDRWTDWWRIHAYYNLGRLKSATVYMRPYLFLTVLDRSNPPPRGMLCTRQDAEVVCWRCLQILRENALSVDGSKHYSCFVFFFSTKEFFKDSCLKGLRIIGRKWHKLCLTAIINFGMLYRTQVSLTTKNIFFRCAGVKIAKFAHLSFRS